MITKKHILITVLVLFLLWLFFNIFASICIGIGLGNEDIYIFFTEYTDYNIVLEVPSETNLDFLSVKTLKKLTDFMEENNLLIKPGAYCVKRNYEFNDLFEVFAFVDANNPTAPIDYKKTDRISVRFIFYLSTVLRNCPV